MPLSFSVSSRACRILAFPNEKGGTGKTTTAWGFIHGLVKAGAKVLAVDLDPQGPNLSFLVGADKSECMGSFEMLSEQAPILDCIQHIDGDPGFDIVAANTNVRNVVFDRGDISALFRLKTILGGVRADYDFIVVDVPTGFNELIANAYIAADDLIIPAEADLLSAEGINDLTANIAKTTKFANPDVRVAGIVIGSYRSNTGFQRGMFEGFSTIGEKIGTRVFSHPIRQSVRIQEAQGIHCSIFDFAPNEKVTKDLAGVVAEYLEMAV